MESKRGADRVYQDFEPSMEWVPEDDSDTLLVYLPGFAKEQLRVQLRARNLIISGERKLPQNTWSRFCVEFPVSGNCDLNKISAKFEVNILFVRQPKWITTIPQKPVDDESNAAAGIESTPTKQSNGKDEVYVEGVCEQDDSKKDKTFLDKYIGMKLKASSYPIVVIVAGLAIAIYASDAIRSGKLRLCGVGTCI